jgi:hypothetical protein
MKTKVFILAAISSIIMSCEEDLSGYGNYIIKVSNFTDTNQNYLVYLDEQFQGQIFANARHSISGSYCNNLIGAANADNVLVLTYVSSGNHTLKIVNSVSNTTATTLDFKMTNDGCVEQSLIID